MKRGKSASFEAIRIRSSMSTPSSWFTETYPKHGSTFSLTGAQKLHEEQTPFQR
jgi:hypothetical protein